MGRGVAVPGPASRAGGAEQQASGFWTESLGWSGKTGEDWQLTVKEFRERFEKNGMTKSERN